MALLRFSAQGRVGRAGVPARRVAGGTVVLSTVRMRHSDGPAWLRSRPRRRCRVPPFRAFPPSPVAAGCPAASLPGVPHAAFQTRQRGLFKVLIPGTECLAVLEDRRLLSWGSPL
jgi:hypothetical protein